MHIHIFINRCGLSVPPEARGNPPADTTADDGKLAQEEEAPPSLSSPAEREEKECSDKDVEKGEPGRESLKFPSRFR
jgi:hypothetical protein